MTMFGRWFRNLVERFLLRVFYEGPNPPKRLEAVVMDWANAHPNATRGDWLAFTKAYGRTVYQSAYTRGLEFAERDLDRMPKHEPALLEETLRNEWGWEQTSGELTDPKRRVSQGEESKEPPPEFYEQEELHRRKFLKERAGLK